MTPQDRYTEIVEWSDEDGCYVGRCPDLMFGGVHGAARLAVYRELLEVVDEWIAVAPPAPSARQQRSAADTTVV